MMFICAEVREDMFTRLLPRAGGSHFAPACEGKGHNTDRLRSNGGRCCILRMC